MKETTELAQKIIVLFDGECGLCDRFVNFLIARDGSDRFRFAALQSSFGESTVRKHGFDPTVLSSVFVIRSFGTPHEKVLRRGRAAIFALGELPGGWRAFRGLRWLPAGLANPPYWVIAQLRYRFFGKVTCRVPNPATSHKFLSGLLL